MAVGHVVIVGAGPAGAALAYLLARRGVEVTLLERHPDFERTFRGDGLQPSGTDAFDQMGLGDRLRQLPQALVHTIDLYQGGRRRARLATASLGFIPCFIPQPAVLGMITEESRKHPSFRLPAEVVARPVQSSQFHRFERRAIERITMPTRQQGQKRSKYQREIDLDRLAKAGE